MGALSRSLFNPVAWITQVQRDIASQVSERNALTARDLLLLARFTTIKEPGLLMKLCQRLVRPGGFAAGRPFFERGEQLPQHSKGFGGADAPRAVCIGPLQGNEQIRSFHARPSM